MKKNISEMLVLVDEKDRKVGEMEKANCHHFPGYLHRAFLVMVLNPRRELLLARRSKKKPLWPGVWDGSVASHPRLREGYLRATQRRLEEEVGIKKSKVRRIGDFLYEAKDGQRGVEKEFCALFIAKAEEKVSFNLGEVDAVRWINLPRLRKTVNHQPKLYTPWFKLALKKFLALLDFNYLKW